MKPTVEDAARATKAQSVLRLVDDRVINQNSEAFRHAQVSEFIQHLVHDLGLLINSTIDYTFADPTFGLQDGYEGL